jgi:Ser/Thr protein kinase RdoA (MazF antagonist)
VIDLLEPILGAPVTLEQLKHKPGRRTTSRAIGTKRRAIVKVYASERAPVVAARIGALAAGPAEPEVPEVLLCVPDAHLVVLSEVPGVPLQEALLRGDLGTCARAGEVIGAWHAAWAGRSPDALVPHTAKRELEILTTRIERASPEVAAAVGAALPTIAGGDWDSQSVVHRDLYEEQVMVGERIGLIDLDDAALGPPELDLGNLIAHIEFLSLRATTDLSAALETVLDGYRRSGPAVDAELLARCRALTLLRLACIHENASLVDRAESSFEPAYGRGRVT